MKLLSSLTQTPNFYYFIFYGIANVVGKHFDFPAVTRSFIVSDKCVPVE
jgi:hypothetical protein